MTQVARILVISRQWEEGKNLSRLLRRDGHRTHIARTDRAARKMLDSWPAELLVLAVPQPSHTMRSLVRAHGSRIRRTPAIAVMNADTARWDGDDVPGLLDPLSTPFSDESFLARVDAMLCVREVLTGTSERREDGTPAGRPGLVGRFLRWLGMARRPEDRSSRPIEPYLEAAASIVGTVECRDAFDPGHGERVAAHCATIAAGLGLSDRQTDVLLRAAAIHDIGKIGIAAELLRKPSLTEADRVLLRSHPRKGAELIRALMRDAKVAKIVLNHHERPDGKGYLGRSGDEIPLLSRVLAVADAFDGMTTTRWGRPALTPGKAVEELLEGRGTAFDAECVDALVSEVRPRAKSIPVSPLVLPGVEH